MNVTEIRQSSSQHISEGFLKYCLNQYNRSRIRIKKDHWVPDELVTHCMNMACQVTFTLTRRKHHCRSCGKIYCRDCSNYSQPVDKNGRFCENGKYAKVCVTCYGANSLHTSNRDSSSINNSKVLPPYYNLSNTSNFYHEKDTPITSISSDSTILNSIPATITTGQSISLQDGSEYSSDGLGSSSSSTSTTDKSDYVTNMGVVLPIHQSPFLKPQLNVENKRISNINGTTRKISICDGNKNVDKQKSLVLSYYQKNLGINSEWSWSSF